MRKNNNNKNVVEIYVLIAKARLARNFTVRIKSLEVDEGSEQTTTRAVHS